MTRLLTIALLGLACFGLVACGDDEEPTTGATATETTAPETTTETTTTSEEFSDEEQIAAAVTVFYGDDLEASCGILSEKALRQVGGIDACLGNAAVPEGTKVEVTDIRIEGDRALAVANTKTGYRVDFELVNEDGTWRIERPLPTIF